MGDTTLLELIYGKGAHVDPIACVEDISAALAARTVSGYPHSIWQIVDHISYWTEYELANIAGENPRYPDKAIESWPQHPNPDEDSSVDGQSVDDHLIDEQWRGSVGRFTDVLVRLARLAQSDAATLDRKIFNAALPQTPRESTVQAVLWQIAVHNSYHVGQIALLRRQFGFWPPRRGGDTWVTNG